MMLLMQQLLVLEGHGKTGLFAMSSLASPSPASLSPLPLHSLTQSLTHSPSLSLFGPGHHFRTRVFVTTRRRQRSPASHPWPPPSLLHQTVRLTLTPLLSIVRSIQRPAKPVSTADNTRQHDGCSCSRPASRKTAAYFFSMYARRTRRLILPDPEHWARTGPAVSHLVSLSLFPWFFPQSCTHAGQ